MDSNAHRETALFSIPFPLTLRNFVPTGLATEISKRFDLDVHLVSPYPDGHFSDPQGHRFSNHGVQSSPGSGGLPEIACVTLLDKLFKSIHLTGFAIEYPDGSLQNIELSARRNFQRVVAEILTRSAPRGSERRASLRRVYGHYRPRRTEIASIFDGLSPRFLLTASPGHQWLDHFVLDEAKRRGIPSVCVILSWDNLYSRGPLCRRPDFLMTWSEEMRRQAIEDHQFPEDRIAVVGALQFIYYEAPVAEDEIALMRSRIGLRPDEQYLAYVCGARTSTYDVEDVLAMLEALQQGPYRDLRVVVRPHPQGSRQAYNRLTASGVLLDRSPDLTSGEERPDALNVLAIRHFAAFLRDARFVLSSWGTTALLEACIFDRPAIQLRWMDAVPHSISTEVQKVRDFQRYIHMRAFDRTEARPYCDDPRDLSRIMNRLEAEEVEFRGRRATAVRELTCLPLGGVVDRVCLQLVRWTARGSS